MSKLPDDKKLVLINMPGSHDSAAFNMNYFGSCFAKTQDIDILEQLKIGVRILDIRVTLNTSCCNVIEEEMEKDTDLILCHGICNCYYIENNKKKNLTYKDVLNQVRDFLLAYPTETIIFKTDSGRGKKNINLNRAGDIFGKLISDISIEYNEKLTLGEARGKVVYTTYISDKITSKGYQMYNTKIEKGTGIIDIHRKHTNNNIKYDISLEIPPEISKGSDLTDSQLCIVFGNLLENAVEACCRTESQGRFIKLCSYIKAGILYIAMDNNCDGNIHIENGGFISSKRNEIGTGINSITAIAKKHGGDAKFNVNGNVFESSVCICI